MDAVLSTLAEIVGAASASITKTVEELIAEILVDQPSNTNLVFGRTIGEVLTRESSNLIVPVVAYKVVAFLSKEGISTCLLTS